MADLKTHAKLLTQFLDKSDGRDKLLAAVQYAAMFVAAGQPGDVKKVQASVATARKVFRIMRPLEALNPILQNPAMGSRPLWVEALIKLKPLLMSIYFGADHVVWAQQAGLLNNKSLTDRAQKTSLYGWFGGSLCTIILELYELAAQTARQPGESTEAYAARQDKIQPEVTKRCLTLIHACFQAALAMGLLELRPWKPRTVGALGIIASLMNCYMLYPQSPAPLFAGWLTKCRTPALKTA
ncbi:hypothetical protein D9Q98_005998 [Chlorella vulgaris]|uniref:Peroxisomal membrane protein 11C n=1 Tax=Chlorella vulgaris TaxID=3077 RepID=A0A9D4TXW0_CHLVU|nr:hypothetical protein D9Q98_005998 [Chlorella vulgaris]